MGMMVIAAAWMVIMIKLMGVAICGWVWGKCIAYLIGWR